jgi:hypothetical protein
MAGWDDQIFANLPGSPRRPKPPPDQRSLMQTMFPVDPREVVGGLMNQATEGAGNLTAAAARRVGLPNPDLLGHDVTGFLQSPTFGGGASPMAGATTLAAAPLAARALRGARTAEEIATGVRSAATESDAATQAARAAQASPGQAALDQMMSQGQAAPTTRLPSSNSLNLPDAPTAEQMDKFGRVENVPLSQARATQNTMGGASPGDLIPGYGDMPVAAQRRDGEYLIFDGHHRAVNAINSGADSMPMYVIDAKDYAPQFAGRPSAPDNMSTDELLRQLTEPSPAPGAAETAAKSGITAYHGSPYDFDRFDMSKIGTGEGAQAYGRGLYFAGNEDVAKNYRNQLAPGFVNADGSPLSDKTYSALAFVQPKYEQSGQLAEGIQDAIGRLKNQSDFYRKNYGAGVNLYDNAVDTLQNLDPATLKPKGHMYQVNINADPDHFLDWDKPLSEQPHIGSALEKAGLPLPMPYSPGSEAYSIASGSPNNPIKATQVLRDAGIPGIKYLDQGSRGAGGEGGTQNYVTFSDDMIDILRKYGLAGLGLTAGAGALSASGQSPVSSPAEAAPSTFPPGMTLNTQPNWSP